MSSTIATRNPLLIPELFQCTLDYLSIPEGDLAAAKTNCRGKHWGKKRALYALAQTCRALSEPSLDCLWQRLDSLAPLVQCFLQLKDFGTINVVLSSPDDWKVATRYCHRIQELVLLTYSDEMILKTALRCLQSPILFPNATLLRWSLPLTHDWSLKENIHRILPPSLIYLSVILDRPFCVTSFLESYISLCPKLKLGSADFDISLPPFPDGTISPSEFYQLSKIICIQNHLESLRVTAPIDDAALRHVMMSLQLKTISVVFLPMQSNWIESDFTIAGVTPFQNVTSLELIVWDLHLVPSLLRSKDQMFHTFRISASRLYDVTTISVLFTTLASPPRTQSLQSIHLTHNNTESHALDNVSYDHATHCLTSDILQPLTVFTHLRELEIFQYNQIFLDDRQLEDLTRNWPMLEVLRFKCNHGCYGRAITLRGLLSILTLCPRLRELSLSLDATEVPGELSATKDVCSTTLISLSLPDSPIHNAHQVVDFFARHLPSVEEVYTDFTSTPSLPYEPPSEYTRIWRQVNNLMWESRVRSRVGVEIGPDGPTLAQRRAAYLIELCRMDLI